MPQTYEQGEYKCVSYMTDEEAQQKLADLKPVTAFSESLRHVTLLGATSKQIAWIHILANRTIPVRIAGDLKPLYDLFLKAKEEGIKKPTYKIPYSKGNLTIKFGTATHKGSLVVINTDEKASFYWYGRITKDGAYVNYGNTHPPHKNPSKVLAYLNEHLDKVYENIKEHSSVTLSPTG